MTYQLSNNQTELAKVIFAVIGVGLPAFILIFFIFGSNNLSIIGRVIITSISLALGFSSLYFSFHLYKVTFDKEFIYLSQLRKTEKVSIEKIEDIKPSFVPFRMLYGNTYIVTVIYFHNEKKHKVKFLSKQATNLVGTVDHIPLLDTHRKFIRDRKYSI